MRIVNRVLKRFWVAAVSLAILFPPKTSSAQSNYSLQLDSINSTGEPGYFLLAPIKLTNTTNQGFSVKIHRIERTIPETWSSCFCYPTCLAPWIDSMEWWVNAHETITIAPNFNTDPVVPGYGYVVVRIYEIGQSQYADTITCSGSTVAPTAVSELNREKVQLFPNPTNSNLYIDFEQLFSGTIEIFDRSGAIAISSFTSNSSFFEYDISHLPSGHYLLRCTSFNDKVILIRFVKE